MQESREWPERRTHTQTHTVAQALKSLLSRCVSCDPGLGSQPAKEMWSLAASQETFVTIQGTSFPNSCLPVGYVWSFLPFHSFSLSQYWLSALVNWLGETFFLSLSLSLSGSCFFSVCGKQARGF